MRERKKKERTVSREKLTRREALSTAGKIAIGVVAAGVIAGVGGYYAGSAVAPAKTVTKTKTVTEAKTITVPATTRTVTVPGTTLTKTKTITITATAAPPKAGIEEWLKKTAEPFKGATIRIVTESTPPSMWVQKVLVPRFEELTGIKVEMELLGWDDQLKKALLDIEAKSGIYDLYYIDELQIMAIYFEKNGIVDLYDLMETKPDLVYPDLDLADLMPIPNFTYEGKLAGLPFEFYLRLYVYRRDLFEDPTERKNFERKYGWELAPPKTWDEYEQIAEFFTRPPKLYGHIAMPSPATIAYDYWMFGLTYGIPNGGMTLARRVSEAEGGMLDSQRSIDFFKRYLNLLKYGPHGIDNFTWDELRSEFMTGRITQGIIFGDQLPDVIGSPESMVREKVDVALPPVEPKYYSPGLPIVHGDMGVWAISSASKNKEAALLFLQWVACKENAAKQMADLGTLCTRKSLLFSPLADEIDKKYKWHYYKTVREAIMSLNLITGPLAPIPEVETYKEIIYVWLSKAVAGELSPEEALRSAAREMDKKMKELGF